MPASESSECLTAFLGIMFSENVFCLAPKLIGFLRYWTSEMARFGGRGQLHSSSF